MKTRHLVALIVIVCATLLSSHPALAQFSQQGPKLVGTDVVRIVSSQGQSVALSADGNTAIIGGPQDNGVIGAAWIWTRSGGVWAQQGTKLVGSGAVGAAGQGVSVSISADANTAIVGGLLDNDNIGAAWIWTRSGGVWTQQGPKLVGSGAVGKAAQGYSVSLSGDGNTAIIGGPGLPPDNLAGAAWVWTRSGGIWTQQGTKLVGSGAVGNAHQGCAVSLSADGNTAIVGGFLDNTDVGAAWVWTRSGGVWTQQGSKLVGSVAVRNALQGLSVFLSADGNTAIVGGTSFNVDIGVGAAWVWTRSGGVWIQQAKLVGSGAVGKGQQNFSVSLSADGNMALVGLGNDNGGAGAAWVWTRSGGIWTQQGTKLVGTGAVGPYVGQGDSVSLSADGGTAIVGGSADNTAVGAAWVFAASAPGTVSHVLVSQRPGTTLVDLFYDLSGAGSNYSVAVAVSSDGGDSFTVPATHFSGDGVTSPAAPGASRHIVWDTGADFPGQFSTRIRIKVAVGPAFAVSPIFTVDTRSVLSGSVFGKVFGNGLALANAQVRVMGTPYTTVSGAGGVFNISNIPSGVGYVVAVAAPGFASASIANVPVTASPRDLGVITLRPLGAHKVIPLVPDLNPAISKVEEGGVAYRYYRVVSADGKTPAGGVTLLARLAGGAGISQTGDIAENWPGREAGVSDADGMVRIRVPSSAVGSVGTTRKVEVLDAGQVVQSFDVRILPFKHEKVWGHSLEGSIAGKLGVVRLEPGGKLETEVKDYYTGIIAQEETIERTRSLTGKAGVEASVGSLKLGSVKAGAKADVGGYMNLQWSGKWRFTPDESDSILNMEKVYFAFGDIIFLGPLGSEFYGKLSDYWYGAGLQDVLMVGSGGEVHLGGYYDGEAGFGIGTIGNVNVRAGGELEGNVGGFLGYERSYSSKRIQDHTILFGFESELQRGIGATAALSKFNGNRLRGLGGGLHWGARNTISARVQTDWNTKKVKASSVTLENEVSSGGDIKFFGWKGVDAPIAGDEKVKLSETYTLTFSEANSFGNVAALGKLWDAVRPGSTITPLINNRGVDETTAALAGAAEESGTWTTYERSIDRSYQGEFTFPIGANTLAAALELDFTAQAERGAAMVLERGVAPGGRLFPQEYQPDQSRALIPTDKIFDKELVWLSRAEFLPTSGFSRFAEYVSTANPNLTIGGRFSMFFHDVAGGAQIVGSDFVRWVKGDSLAPQRKGLKGPLPGPLPQAYQPGSDQTNYVYGVSSLLQLTPGTNAFPGTATLVMLYSDDQITGLNEADLRIYRLPDGTNQWQLVGGIVNTVSNSVTTVISNFGTYAISAPMPSGNVNLQATNLNLIANGTNELMLIATNLLLNTGGIASNAWLFTVDAVGIELLNADLSTHWTGVQVASSNGILQVRLRVPVGGTHASVSVSSVAGDARGHVGINLIDAVPPVAPANVLASAGQSRVRVSWQTNREPDIAGYRVYYRAGTVGPPWDGTAAVEGTESPVSVTGTNCLLRGLVMGTNYFVSIATVDTTGNESPLAPAINVTTSQQPPAPPTGVASRFGEDGTNVLMWTLSEDDGYNDRDVVRYDVWRVVMPGTNWLKVGEVEAGIGLFSEANLTVGATQYVRYAVAAVDQLGATSALILVNRFVTGTPSVDNDGDGMADDWERQYGLSAENPGDANDDPDHDGLTNLQEYQLGLNPLAPDRPYLEPLLSAANGAFALNIQGLFGRSATLEISTNLMSWQILTNLTGTNATIYFEDRAATNYGQRFYRAVVP